MTTARKKTFLQDHSLSLVSACVLAIGSSSTLVSIRGRTSAYLGNAIADWTGFLVTVLATKFLFEIGSVESRKPSQRWLSPCSDSRKIIRSHFS